MEGREQVCLAEEAARLWRSGLNVDEISSRMGLDSAWVREVVGPPSEGEDPDPDERPSRRA